MGSVSGGGDCVGGLAGEIGNDSTIRSCHATVAVSGYESVGGLVGQIYSGTISLCTAAGTVSGYTQVGGLAGWNDSGTLSQCSATGAISGSSFGCYYAGGLVGQNYSGMLSECSATGTISDGDDWVGGLAGWNESGMLSLCSASGAVSGNDWVGGLVGYNISGTLSECSATGSTVDGSEFVGGLAGRNDSGTVSGCSAAADVSGVNDVGGLMGWNDSGMVSGCNVTGSVSGDGSVGGLTGCNVHGAFESCRASGAVSGSDYVGGLLGLNYDNSAVSMIRSCHATGTVNGTTWVGGLVGYNQQGSISLCSATGEVVGINPVGGLVGYNEFAVLSECSATGAVSGDHSVGGLVGLNDFENSIRFCNATGAVSGYNYTGGLVGLNNGNSTVFSCYATGTASGSFEVGGLMGYNELSVVSQCYSTGAVSGDEYVGGLIGYNNGIDNLSSCFWDIDTSGTEEGIGGELPESPGTIGKTTEEMKTLATFTNAGWDFSTAWFMPFDGYPYLRWELDGRYSGGLGTAARPYEIANVNDLLALAAATGDYGKSFVVVHDIDLSGYTFSRALIAPDTSLLIGYQGTVFCGVFDGGGHVIRNLRIDSTSEYAGLFGWVGEGTLRGRAGTVRDLGLIDADVRGSNWVGGLVGKLNHGTISGCFTTGQVRASGSYAGGLVGYNGSGSALSLYGGEIGDCYCRCAVLCDNYVGGLAGFNYQSEIRYCYSTGEIRGLTNAGGLVGAVTTGGGYADTGNFWDTDTSRMTVSAMGLGRPTKGMKALSMYSGASWDLANTWAICQGTNYPRLQWQIPAADWVCPDGVAMEDLAYLAARWLEGDCGATENCEGADLDVSGTVEMADFATFAKYWLEAI